MFMTKAVKRLNSCVWGPLRTASSFWLVMLALVRRFPIAPARRARIRPLKPERSTIPPGAVVPGVNVLFAIRKKARKKILNQ